MKAEQTMTPEELAAWERDPMGGFVPLVPAEHGKSSALYTAGCRCRPCTDYSAFVPRRRKLARLDLSDVIDFGVAP